MADVHCANCGSARVNALADAVGCDDCGAATSYTGEIVHGPTARVLDAEPAAEEEKAASKRTTTKSTKKG